MTYLPPSSPGYTYLGLTLLSRRGALVNELTGIQRQDGSVMPFGFGLVAAPMY